MLVDVFASWCAVCHDQELIVDELLKKPKYRGFALFLVDYDRQKPVMRKLGAILYSTLIAYRGRAEVGRLVGDTGWTTIDAILARAI